MLRRNGAFVMSFFALVWAAAAASGIRGGVAVAAVGLAAGALSVAAMVFAARAAATAGRDRNRALPPRWNHGVGVVNTAQVAAILLTVFALVNLDRPALLPAAICLIVGAHFFPLARLFDQRQYVWTGAGLTAVAVVGFAVSAAGVGMGATRAVVGLGAAAVLWGTSFHVAARN